MYSVLEQKNDSEQTSRVTSPSLSLLVFTLCAKMQLWWWRWQIQTRVSIIEHCTMYIKRFVKIG